MPENQSMNKLVQALGISDKTAREKIREKLITFGQRAIPHLTMATRDESLAEEVILTLKAMPPRQALEGLYNIIDRKYISERTRDLAQLAIEDIRKDWCITIDLNVTQSWKKCEIQLERHWSKSPCEWAYATVTITYMSGAVDEHTYENVDLKSFLDKLRGASLYKKGVNRHIRSW